MKVLRGCLIFLSFIMVWQLIIWIRHLPPYILPSPLQVFLTFGQDANILWTEAIPTIIETLLGLILGSFFGISTALLMIWLQPLRFWLLPILVISQAIPIFAIAPLLVLWLGYGLSSKIVVTMMMLFFPVTSSFYDGLRRTKAAWLDIAHIMGGNKLRTLWHIQIPAALPALASGLKVASTLAPIGAIIAEWVGASQGLGFLMLNANARMQISLMFAAMFSIMLFAFLLYFGMDKLVHWLLPWEKDL